MTGPASFRPPPAAPVRKALWHLLALAGLCALLAVNASAARPSPAVVVAQAPGAVPVPPLEVPQWLLTGGTAGAVGVSLYVIGVFWLPRLTSYWQSTDRLAVAELTRKVGEIQAQAHQDAGLSADERHRLLAKLDAAEKDSRARSDQLWRATQRILELMIQMRGAVAPAGVLSLTDEPPPPDGPRLLIVDDYEPLVGKMRCLLASLGYQVVTAVTRAEALAALRSGTFAAVVSDLGLPDGSGVDVLRYARSLTPPPRVVAVTGRGDGRLAEAERLGLDAVFTKPVDLPDLLASLPQAPGPPAAPAPESPPCE